MKYTSLLFVLFIVFFGQPAKASFEDMSLSELDQIIVHLEQDIKTTESKIGNETAELLQLQMNLPEAINCTVNNNTSTNITVTPWMRDTAYGLTAISIGLTVIGPLAELINDIRKYGRKGSPLPAFATAGWPTLDFFSNAFFLVHLNMSYLRNNKLLPYILNGLASLAVMAIETTIDLFLFIVYCKHKIQGAEGQLLIRH